LEDSPISGYKELPVYFYQFIRDGMAVDFLLKYNEKKDEKVLLQSMRPNCVRKKNQI